MTDRMLVKSAPGLRVRDPQSLRHLPEDGQLVPRADMYWQRRLADGDVVEVAAAAEPKPKATKE